MKFLEKINWEKLLFFLWMYTAISAGARSSVELHLEHPWLSFMHAVFGTFCVYWALEHYQEMLKGKKNGR